MITNKSNFEGAANSLIGRYTELSRKSEEALALFQKEQYEEAYEAMLDLARKSERATLISRKLPTHTGNPKADAEIDTVLEEACPIQMASSCETGSFCGCRLLHTVRISPTRSISAVCSTRHCFAFGSASQLPESPMA